MISCKDFVNILNKNEFRFFTGIPDSTFKEFMKYLSDIESKSLNNIVACNECEAIALAAGYHLATNKIGVVYLQNSGLGKTVNPITSLCDAEVYSIPILLMIGWRGEPGQKDAPQHKKMGKITLPLLDILEIPYIVLNSNLDYFKRELIKARKYLKTHNSPIAFVFRRNFFKEYEINRDPSNFYLLTTTDVINLILDNLNNTEIIISTTGYISRKVFEYRENKKQDHQNSFYNIGSMGCASSIGLSIALQKPNRRIIIFDGDGATIMQMGALTTIGKNNPPNLVHVVLDNEAHESTGGQPTNSPIVDFTNVANACNYNSTFSIQSRVQLLNCMEQIRNGKGPILLHIKVKLSQDRALKRPNKHPKEYKEDFMKNIL